MPSIEFTDRELTMIRIGLGEIEQRLMANIEAIEKAGTPDAPVTPENNKRLKNIYDRLRETTDAAMKIVEYNEKRAG